VPDAEVRVRPLRPGHALGDMARSLGLLVALAAAVLLLTPARALIWPTSKDLYPAVDVRGPALVFASRAHVAAMLPVLPTSWRPTVTAITARPRGAYWFHTGWSVSGARYAGLDQGTGPAQPLLASVLGSAGLAVRGTEDIAGTIWQTRRSGRGERALTRQLGALTLVITGNATDAQLRQFAASLRPV
jgi:hypothetical protein